MSSDDERFADWLTRHGPGGTVRTLQERSRAEAESDETTTVLYEFTDTCGCIASVTVDAKTHDPPNRGPYVCPNCGSEEWPPR